MSTDLSDITQRDLPPKNHNNPPSEVEMLGETLTLKYVHSMRSAEGHIAMAKNIPDHFEIESDAVWTTDFIKLMQNSAKHFENLRKEEKEPYLRQGQYVDTFFGEYIKNLEAAIAKAKIPLDDWLKRKADAERAEREADAKLLQERATDIVTQANAGTTSVEHAVEAVQEAAIAKSIAALPTTGMARTSGKASSAGLNTKWVGIVTNVEQLDLTKLRPYLSLTELQRALDRAVKAGLRQCNGADISEAVSVKVK